MKTIKWIGYASVTLLVACEPITGSDTAPVTSLQPDNPDIVTTTSSTLSVSIEDSATESTALPRQDTQLIVHPLCLYSCPLGADATNFLVDHTIFLLSSNRETKFADWVAYLVEAGNLYGGSRPRNWKKDPDIPIQFTLSPSDYEGANAAFQYDRGHQTPLGDFSNHPDWAKTNYLSNITPQKADFNQGAWANLELKVRALAVQVDTVYVTTGTVYLSDMPSLPNAALPHRIPSGYWKIIAVLEEDNQIRLASFFLEQATPRAEDICEHSASLSEIEDLTGFTFFADYPFNDTTSLLVDLGCQENH